MIEWCRRIRECEVSKATMIYADVRGMCRDMGEWYCETRSHTRVTREKHRRGWILWRIGEYGSPVSLRRVSVLPDGRWERSFYKAANSGHNIAANFITQGAANLCQQCVWQDGSRG